MVEEHLWSNSLAQYTEINDQSLYKEGTYSPSQNISHQTRYVYPVGLARGSGETGIPLHYELKVGGSHSYAECSKTEKDPGSN